MPYYSPSRETRNNQAVRVNVADRLRTAVELEQARQHLRDLNRAGQATETDRARVRAAETNWDAIKIRDWQVTS